MSFNSVDIQGVDLDESMAQAIVDPIFKNNDFEKTSSYLRALGVSALFTQKGDHLEIICKPTKRIKLGVGTEVSQHDVTFGLSLLARNLRNRLDNLQFKANFGQFTHGLFELQYKIPLVGNLLSHMLHSVRFGNIATPLKTYERTISSKFVVEHETLPLVYKVGPEVSIRSHSKNSHFGGLGHEVVYDTTDSILPSRGIKWKIGQFTSTWDPNNFSIQLSTRITSLIGNCDELDKIYSGGPLSIRGIPLGAIKENQFIESGVTLFGPWFAFVRPFGFVDYGSSFKQFLSQHYGFGSFGGGIAIGFGNIRGEIYYCSRLRPQDTQVQERIHVGLGMEFL